MNEDSSILGHCKAYLKALCTVILILRVIHDLFKVYLRLIEILLLVYEALGGPKLCKPVLRTRSNRLTVEVTRGLESLVIIIVRSLRVCYESEHVIEP
jgi:hypothetical protein